MKDYKYQWHDWFAWHPVFIGEKVYWRQLVQRVRFNGRYYYRLKYETNR